MKVFDREGRFVISGANDERDIRSLTIRGAGTTVFGGGAALVVQVISTVVLARLLMPSDFGLVAMVTTFSLLLVNFGFNGFTEAIVQRETMEEDLAGALFWINVSFGILLTAGFAAMGSLLSRFYHDHPVRQVAVGISLTIVCTSVSTIHLALLKRAMRFTWISINDVVARIVSVVFSISFALMGWGYWALVIGAIAQPISIAVGAFLLCNWRPTFPKRVPGTERMLRFALSTYGNFAVNYFSRNTDNLLVGWKFDAASLGFYKKAYDLFALSANQLVSSIAIVVVAGLSRVRRDSELYRSYLLNAIGVMAFIGMGLGAVLTLVGRDLIFVLLGPRWTEAGQIFTYFGPGVGIMILYATHGWIHLSAGRPDRWFRWSLVEFGTTVALFLVAVHWGPVGMASAWSISFWILTLPAIAYAGAPIRLGASSVVACVWRYIVASFAAVVAASCLMRVLPHALNEPGIGMAIFRVILAGISGVLLYLGGVLLLHLSTLPLRQVFGLVQEVFQAKRSQAIAPYEEAPTEAPVEALFEQSSHKSPAELPLVSILVPAYNAQEWLPDTLRSALAQTWPHIEIIVVDDGSRDRTLEAARRFESQGVIVISQQNSGAAAARNRAFAACHGEYIQWLDADDLLSPDKIAHQMELVLSGLDPRTLLSCAWGCFMYRAHRAEFTPTDLWCSLTPQEWLLRKMEQNIYMQTSTWLISRELTMAAGPWDVRMLGDDDGEYFCRVLLASNGIRFVSSGLVYYRTFRYDSLSYIGRFPNKIDAHWASMELHIKYLRMFGDSERTRAACIRFLHDSLIYFYPESLHILDRAREVAEDLGEHLGTPDLSWKYSWMETLFGWNITKSAQHGIRRIRWRLTKRLDYFLYRTEGSKQLIPS